jgi:vancomycin aglycone glucosyltransferase
VRVLLSTIGSRGDVQPLVALALQLRARGADAHFCVPPDFRAWIEGLGFAVTPVGPEVTMAGAPRPATAASPAPPTPEQIRQIIDATVAAQFGALTTAVRGCDVVVAATALQIAARTVAEQAGVPYIFGAYCPIVLPSAHHAPPPLPPAPGEAALPEDAGNGERWARNRARFNATFRDSLNAQRTALGMAPVDDVQHYMFTDRPWLPADPTVAPWPDLADGAVFQTGAWILPDERPLARELQAFLDAGEPPIYFGFSSMHIPPEVADAIVASARAVGRRALVSSGWAGLSVGDAADCLTIGEANLRTVFGRVAAVVHHGGAGTTTLAALCGAPQVIAPHVYDQRYFARRIEELGIGVAHAHGAITAESLTAALQRALPSDVAARARSTAAAVRLDGAQIAAESLYRASSA